MFRRLISTSATGFTIPLRLALGAIFIAHGAQKTLGSFGGPGFEKWTSIPPPMPFMKPAGLWLGLAAIGELVGGILVLLGVLTRLGAFLIICVMLTAIVSAHWPAFFAPKGMEYPMSLLAMSLALLISGGGMASIDRSLAGRR